MNFNQLRYFVAIVKHGSFWSAALEEYISQSSLSKQIKALETELGVVLFNRTGNKITLTEAGQCFYDYALQLLETKNEMHQELMAFEDTPIEEVKFASIPIVSSYKISTLLSEFQKVNKNRRQVVNYNILEEEQKAKSYTTKVNSDKEIKEGTKESIYHYIWKDEDTGEFIFDPNRMKLDIYNFKVLNHTYSLQVNLSTEYNKAGMAVGCSTDKTSDKLLIQPELPLRMP